MADPILGPNVQPLPPSNPFFAGNQQGMTASLTVNTQSASEALNNLTKMLDGMVKTMGASWDKATADNLSKQERFYRAIGDKENERRLMLNRYKNEAIAAIEAEKNAKIASYEEEARIGKLSHDQLEKHKTNASEKATAERTSIEQKTAKKLASESGIGGLIRNKTSEIGGQIGGPVGSLISSAGALVTNPYALAFGAILEMLNTKAAFTSTGAQLAGAGLKLGSGAGAGLNFDQSLFGGPVGRLGQALSAGEQRQIIATMAGSRTMIDEAQGKGGFAAIRGNLGLFANILPDAGKEMELFTDATKSLGMSQKDITDTFVSSRVNAEKLKITQLDAIKTQMDMQKALRNITNDGAVAASTLFNISGYLNSIGASEAEKTRIAGAIGQAGASLTLPQIAGMFAFTHNGKIPGPGELFGEGGMLGNQGSGVFGLMGSFLTKVGNQFKDPTQRMFAANQLQTQFLPGLRLQDTPKFFELTEAMMSGNMSTKEFGKQFEILESKTPQVAMAEGIKTLSEIVDPIKRLENVFSNFWTLVDAKINKVFESLGKMNPFRVEHWTSKNTFHRADAAHPNQSVGELPGSKGK